MDIGFCFRCQFEPGKPFRLRTVHLPGKQLVDDAGNRASQGNAEFHAGKEQVQSAFFWPAMSNVKKELHFIFGWFGFFPALGHFARKFLQKGQKVKYLTFLSFRIRTKYNRNSIAPHPVYSEQWVLPLEVAVHQYSRVSSVLRSSITGINYHHSLLCKLLREPRPIYLVTSRQFHLEMNLFPTWFLDSGHFYLVRGLKLWILCAWPLLRGTKPVDGQTILSLLARWFWRPWSQVPYLEEVQRGTMSPTAAILLSCYVVKCTPVALLLHCQGSGSSPDQPLDQPPKTVPPPIKAWLHVLRLSVYISPEDHSWALHGWTEHHPLLAVQHPIKHQQQRPRVCIPSLRRKTSQTICAPRHIAVERISAFFYQHQGVNNSAVELPQSPNYVLRSSSFVHRWRNNLDSRLHQRRTFLSGAVVTCVTGMRLTHLRDVSEAPVSNATFWRDRFYP